MGLKQIKSNYEKLYSKLIANHRSISEAKADNEHVKHYLANVDKLSKEEMEQIRQVWGTLKLPLTRGYKYYRGVKQIFGFNPRFLPSSYFFPYIEEILNPRAWKKMLAHKSIIELLYSGVVNTPTTVLRSFGGVLLDEHFNPLTAKEATMVIKACDTPLLYKPATESEQGSGIEIFGADRLSELSMAISSGLIFERGTDFVLQKLIEQTQETAIFNPTSLNCIRVTTLNLNGKVSVGSIALKCGPKNSVVDNIGSGKRGVIVGVDATGKLCSNGYFGNGETTQSHNGITFANREISNVPKLLETATRLHELVQGCKIIGWDLALDIHGEPVLVEGNTVYPGISLEQMCSGPIFGDRTDEVIDYLKVMGGG